MEEENVKYQSYEEFEKVNEFGKGEENSAYARFFIGKSYLKPLTPAGVVPFFANVTFEPGCRNNWHIHRAASGGGQLILCVAGGKGGIGNGEKSRAA